jgi:hypothetical protein
MTLAQSRLWGLDFLSRSASRCISRLRWLLSVSRPEEFVAIRTVRAYSHWLGYGSCANRLHLVGDQIDLSDRKGHR